MLLKTLFFYTVLSGLFFSVPEPLFAQRDSREIRKAEREKKRQERIDRKNYEKERERLIEEHISRQSPEVQERMKQNERDSRRLYKARRGPFYKRWFRESRNGPFYKRWWEKIKKRTFL